MVAGGGTAETWAPLAAAAGALGAAPGEDGVGNGGSVMVLGTGITGVAGVWLPCCAPSIC